MTTDEGRELLCNIQGPIAAPVIAISQARFAAGRLYEHHINFSAIFSADLPFSRQPAGNGRPPPSPCASHSEVSGRLGTRKFDQMRIKICFSPNQAPPNPATTRLVRLLVPNLCS